MSASSSQAISGVTFGDENKTSPIVWLIVAVAVVAVVWMFKRKS